MPSPRRALGPVNSNFNEGVVVEREKGECIWEKFTEKVMASHSSTLAWKIPWTEEPGRLQSVGWLRVGHD